MPRFTTALFAILLAAAGSTAVAQEKPKKSDLSATQETAAVEFARANHPELADLLERLEASDRSSYEKAVRDIAATSERLAKLRETDPERHALVVRNWTLDSRARLLTARLTMSDDPELRGELKKLLRQRQDGRLALLKLDRNRTSARLEKLDSQIEDLERNRDAAIERDLAKVDRAVKATARDRKPAERKKPKADPKKAAPKKPTEDKPAGDRD